MISQTVISLHPKDRVVIQGEDLTASEVEELREHVDKALADPDYIIITNFYLDITILRPEDQDMTQGKKLVFQFEGDSEESEDPK